MEYLVPDNLFAYFQERSARGGLNVLESAEAWNVPNWRLGDPGTKILVWNTGHWGDGLFTTALVRALKKRNPSLAIDIVADRVSHHIWHRNKDIEGFRLSPLLIKVLGEYDGLIMLDEAGGGYDSIFQAAGILDYEDSELIPNLPLFDSDEQFWARAMFPEVDGKRTTDVGYIVLGLHTSSKTRNLPPQTWRDLVVKLYEANPNLPIYGLSSDAVGAGIQSYIAEAGIPTYKGVHAQLNIRSIACLIRLARVVISPDTLFVHLAAAVGTPCAALMSTFAPLTRLRGYPLCVSIFRHDACRELCEWHAPEFTMDRLGVISSTECYTPQTQFCKRMDAITPDEIMQAAGVAMMRKFNNQFKGWSDLPA